MSEVLTRSIATTSCTLLPILALLLFGGSTLQDFAFALLIGVASGAYSSIFIASPVLTHWKEREAVYRHRRERIESEFGFVPAYAGASGDIEPERPRGRRRPGRITTPDPETVSSAEFEQMKRDIAEEEAEPSGHTSTLTQRLAHTRGGDAPAPRKPARPAPRKPARPASPQPAAPPQAETKAPAGDTGGNGDSDSESEGFERAPDVAENDGVAQTPKTNRPAKPRSRNRRHGRRR
jgi:SecD/SecF fusion protein